MQNFRALLKTKFLGKKGTTESESKPERRIVLLGKTGDGKSSTGNKILQKTVFTAKSGPVSTTNKHLAKDRVVDGRKLTVIDTPGIFDTEQIEETIKSEIIRSVIKCAPFVHAFVIVLKVGRYTKQEEEIVDKIHKYFGNDTFKHAVILFTYGDQLECETVEEYVKQSPKLQSLVNKCEGRCHVIDNKYWNDARNEVQVRNLLDTIDRMVEKYGHYTNKFISQAGDDIQNEMNSPEPSLSPVEQRDRAESIVYNTYLNRLAGVATGTLIGAFLGIGVAIASVVVLLKAAKSESFNVISTAMSATDTPNVKAVVAARAAGAAGLGTSTAAPIMAAVGAGVAEGAVAGTGIGAAAGTGIAAGCIFGAAAVAGAIGGGITGYRAAENAVSVSDAIKKSAQENVKEAKAIIIKVEQFPSDVLFNRSKKKSCTEINKRNSCP